MEENELAMPFESGALNEKILHKILRKIKKITVSLVRRIGDIFVGLIGMIILIPLTIIVFCQNLKNKDYGKLFYTQERIGKDGKIFKMYKYRTMVTNADEILQDMLKNPEMKKEYEKYRKIKFDPRITKFGKVLRDSSLAEFPQFINILKGDMSFIGPRPYMPEEKERMGEYYNYIIQHKPGLTGVFQISGEPAADFSDRLDMDVRYHYNKTIWLDLKIAFITLLVTLRRKATFGTVGSTTFDTLDYLSGFLTLGIKRLIDIVGALVGIAILLPLTVVVYIGNKICKDEGPVFYIQERIGKDGKIFKMYKYRSMVVGAEDILKEMLAKDEDARAEYEKYKKLKHDPRVTKWGEFLRRTSVDEFPQFINVLKGEMSIVGPRAYLVREKKDMGAAYETIIQCKPGITGLWQVSGRSDVSFENRLDLDLEYHEKYNLGLDIEILFKTIFAVLNKEGAA